MPNFQNNNIYLKYFIDNNSKLFNLYITKLYYFEII